MQESDEIKIEKYFLIIEKVAKNRDWPTVMYCLFLQNVLTGKAKDVYRAPLTSQCADYALVKETIIQAYELVPKAYGHKLI